MAQAGEAPLLQQSRIHRCLLPEVAEVRHCPATLMFQLLTVESSRMEEQGKEASQGGRQEMARQKELVDIVVQVKERDFTPMLE